MRALRFAWPVLAALTQACTIIVQANPPPPGGGGGAPLTCVDTVDPNTKTAQILFDLRINRGTTNLSKDYAKIVEQTAFGLFAAKIITTQAVMIRADERPVAKPLLAAWGCQADDPRTLQPSDVIDYYATQEGDLPSSPIGCATDPLVSIAGDLANVTTSYPPRLPGKSGVSLLRTPPSVLIVIHVDDQERMSAFADAPCINSHKLFEKDDQGNATWLAYPGGNISADRVVHWFIVTEENVDRDAFVAKCKMYDGFPVEALDLIDPSDRALYGPLGSTISDQGGGHVANLSLCAALTDTEFNKFLTTQIQAVADIVGTSVDQNILKKVLSGQGLDMLPNETGM